MFIYKITNTINNKTYVGKTTKSIQERFRKHQQSAKYGNTYLYRAMVKYGVDNFKIEIVEECEGDLNDRERHWIAELRPEYNMTGGGDGGDTSSSPNFKAGVAEHHASRTSYPGSRMLGKTHSEETKLKQSKAREEHWANLSEEQREVRSQKVSGSNNGMFGKAPKNSLRVLYKGVQYASITAAARDTGHSPNYIKKHGELYYE